LPFLLSEFSMISA